MSEFFFLSPKWRLLCITKYVNSTTWIELQKAWFHEIFFYRCYMYVHTYTVWKLKDIPITQILREIKIAHPKSSLTICQFNTLLKLSEFLFLWICTLWRLRFAKLSKCRAKKMAKMLFSELSENWFHVKSEQ